MKKFLLIQLRPEDEAAESEYKAFLRHGGLDPEEVERFRIESHELPQTFRAHQYQAILVGGSPFDVSTPEEKKSSLQKRIEADFRRVFDEVITNDIPFLGACSGAGLLGSYCRGTISKEVGEPVGGVDVFLTEEGKEDPLLQGFPEKFRALVGHKEGCVAPPPGSVLLAFSETCPVQMFRVGENVYATQFHPEADANEFEVRINIYKHHGYFPPEEAEKLIEAVHQEKTPFPQKILRRFVARYRSS